MEANTHTLNRFIDPIATANILGIDPQTLAEWRHKGIGPDFYKFGRSVRYLVSEVTEWANSRKTASTASTRPMGKANEGSTRPSQGGAR